MKSRHGSRKLAMQLLYQVVTRDEELDNFIDSFVEQSDYEQSTKDFGIQLAESMWQEKNKVDQLIKDFLIGWTLDRVSIVDLSILRLAFYELLFLETPKNVVLNEAVELAKEFSSDESPKFINGILGKYVESDVYRNR
tara:strand:- start:1705 stop:2118 length:414 start_codon:yes stop_codon:yes gene_type:complete